MKFFFLPLFLITFLCNAQDTSAFKKGNTKTFKHSYILSVNTGINFPLGDYGTPQANSSEDLHQGDAYGFSDVGFHLDFNGTYMISKKIGLMVRFGLDENSTFYGLALQPPINRVSQYLTGVCKSVNSYQSKFNVSFVGLIGLVTTDIPMSNYYGDHYGGSGSTIVPGEGSGFGVYLGIELTRKLYKFLYMNLSLGCLGSGINFHNSVVTNYIYSGPLYTGGTYTVSNSTTNLKMDLYIIQTNLGFSFHI